uniref:Tyrosinase copper-binding domain-containing protein n=1 Tax=Salix viminalis TaxID=40686 RepID=A0A6N2NJ47_SALVM
MVYNLSPLTTSPIAISTSSLCPSILKTHAPFLTRNQSHANFPTVSCKARNDDHQNPSTRRDVLIGLGGLYGATNLSDPFAYAKPIQPPDISDCSVTRITSRQKLLILISPVNLNVMYRQLVTANYPTLFLGRPYRAGDEPEPGAGSLEDVPHSTVHIWTGDADQPNRENMGVFYAAARDPIFFSHHGNIDRLWEVWKKLPGGKRKNFTDPDWLDTAFLFYDENANLVRVKIRDCLDTTKLRYEFQDVASPWINARPKPKPNKQKPKVAVATADPTKPIGLLNKTVSVVVQRPNKRRSTKAKEVEVLVIERIEYRIDMYVKFNVLINDEPDTPGKPDSAEFAGTFVNVPHGRNNTVKTSLRLGISELLEDLKAEDDESVVVTLVPITNIGEATIGTLRIELLND